VARELVAWVVVVIVEAMAELLAMVDLVVSLVAKVSPHTDPANEAVA